jgi:hypothetical protein
MFLSYPVSPTYEPTAALGVVIDGVVYSLEGEPKPYPVKVWKTWI